MTGPSSLSRRQVLAAVGVSATGVGGYAAGAYTADAAPDWLADRDGDCSSASLTTSETDWAFPRHDRTNTSHAPARAGPDWPLEQVWETEWPVGRAYDVSGLVVADDIAVALLPGAPQGVVVALSLDSGRVRWSHRADDAEYGQVLAASGRAFVETEVPETDAQFAVRSLGDGSTLWTSPQFTHAPRQLARGRLLSFKRSPDRSRTDVHFAATALNAETGAECWRTVHPGRSHDAAVVDGRVLVTTADGVVALDPMSGEQQWRSDPDCRAIAVADGRMVSGETTLSACSLADGTLEWRARSERYFAGEDAADEEHQRPGFEVGAVTPEAVVYRLDVYSRYPDRIQARSLESGDLLWDFGPEPRPVKWHSYLRPIVVGDDVIVVRFARREGSENPPVALVRLDAATGTEQERITLADERVYRPVVAGGFLLLPTDERVIAYA